MVVMLSRKAYRFRLVGFFILWLTHIETNAVQMAHAQQLKQIDMVFSGQFHEKIDRHNTRKCVAMCNQYKTLSSQKYEFHTGVLYNQRLCFCSSSSFTDGVFNNGISRFAHCSAIENTCLVREFSTVNLTSGLWNVTVQNLQDQSIATNQPIKLSMIKVEGGKNIPIKYRWKINQQPIFPFQLRSNFSYTFETAGYNYLAAQVRNHATMPVTKEILVKVDSKISEPEFGCNQLGKDKQQICHVMVHKGSNMDLKFKVKYQETQKEISLTGADAYAFEIGYMPSTLPESGQEEMTEDGFYLNPDMIFDESGFLEKISLVVEKPGEIELFIVQPKSKLCLEKRKCDSEPLLFDLTKPLHKARKFSKFFNGKEMPKIEVKSRIKFSTSNKGLQTFQLLRQKIFVDKGDLIGCSVTKNENKGQIQFTNHNVPSLVYPNKKTKTSQSRIPYKTSMKIPPMKIFLVKPFKMPVVLKPTKRDYAELSLVVKNDLDYPKQRSEFIMVGPPPSIKLLQNSSNTRNTRLNTTRSRQENIKGISFQRGFPRQLYLRDDKENITIKMNLLKGTNVTYFFDIPAIGEYIQTALKEIAINVTRFKTGTYKVIVIAANQINAIQTTKTINIRRRKTIHTIISAPSFNRVDTGVRVLVNITDLFDPAFLDISFGDGISNKEFIPSNELDESISFQYTYTYDTCGEFKIQTQLRVLLPTGELKILSREDRTINVYCDINIFPKVINDQVWISKSRPLLVNLKADTSSTFTIHWGDGIVHQTDEAGDLQVPHIYGKGGIYQLVTEIKGSSQSLMELPAVRINVTDCGPPLVIFSYGSKDKPEIYRFSMSKVITGVWLHETECKSKVEPHFNVKSWLLRYSNGSLFRSITKKQYTVNKQSTSFWIQPRSIPIGDYKVELTMSYKGFEEIYTGFIRLIASEIVARIINGVEATVPYAIMDGTDVILHHFKVDAGQSIDVDDRRAKTDGMDFEWSCRLASSVQDEERAKSIRKKNNLTKAFIGQEMCSQRDWIVLNANTSAVELFTGYLNEGLTYEFKVNVTKGTRQSTAIQRLMIANDVTPPMKITCLTNCGEKINTADRFVLHAISKKIGPVNRVVAKWTITSINGERLDNPDITRTGFNHRNLVIKPNQLAQNETYNFTLSIGYVGQEGKATFVFIRSTSIAPHSGKCDVEPKTGTANDRFYIWCDQWKNEEQPTFYEFYYNKEITRPASLPILNPTSTNINYISNVLLPAGPEKRNYTVDLIIFIRNKFGQLAEYTDLSVIVKPIELTKKVNIASLATSLIPDNPKDVASITSAAQAISNLFQMAKLQTPTEPDVDPFTGLAVKIDKHEEKRREEAQLQRKQVKQQMITYLKEVDMSNPMEVGSVAGAISSITEDADDLTPDSQDNAIFLITKITSNLENHKENDDIDENQMSGTITNVLNAASNLFTNEVKNAKRTGGSNSSITQNSTANGNKANGSIANINKLVKTLDVGFSMLAKHQVEGETVTVGKTKSFEYGIQKASAFELDDVTIGNGGFVLPESSSMFNSTTMGESLSVVNIDFENNVFVADADGAKNIKSKVTSLTFKAGKDEVKVSNTSSPIVITIQNKPKTIEAENISLLMPGLLKMHSIRLDSTDCQLIININPVNIANTKTRLYAYGQYGKPPTSTSYDFKFVLKQDEPLVVLAFNQSSNHTDPFNVTQRLSIAQIDNTTFVVWGFNEHSYAYMNKSIMHMSFTYDGKMPELIRRDNPYTFDMLEESGRFNYSLKTFCAKCSYWNEEESLWKSDGCQICQIGNFNEVKKELTQISQVYRSRRRKVFARIDNHGLTALHYAVKHNHLEVVKLLVEYGADVNAMGKDEILPIHCVTFFTRGSNASILQFLLSRDANINACDNKCSTLLHYACSKGNIYVVEKLIITQGINIKVYDYFENTALHCACNSGSMEVVDMLVKNDGLKNCLLEKNKAKFNCFHIACSQGHAKLLNYLLDLVEKTFGSGKIASVLEEKNINGNSLLHLAVLGSHLNMTKNLLERGCDVHSPLEDDDTVLHIAAVSGNLEMMELLLKYIDVDFIDKKNKVGQTPLHKAARLGKLTVVTKLLAVGAEVNNPDGNHVTPVMLAASSSSNVRTIQSIMKHNADIMLTDREDCTALHVATTENNVGAVKMLLTSDQCIEIIRMKDSAGNTALHIACREGFEDIAVVLMEKGADVKSRNNMKKTPLHLAAYYGQNDVVDKIIDINSSTINDNDSDGNTPIHCAAENGKADVIKYLLKSGASVNDKNGQELTPMEIAAKNGHIRAVKVLLCGGGNTKPSRDAEFGPLQYACIAGHCEVIKYLLDYCDLRETDSSGRNVLDLAIDFMNEEAAMEILSHRDWLIAICKETVDEDEDEVTIALRNKKLDEDEVKTPIRKLTCFMPDVAKFVFDKCIETNRFSVDHPDFAYRLRYDFINETYRVKPRQEKEAHLFSYLVRFERKELLSHPLVKAAVTKKWQNFAAHFYHFKLILYVCFLTFLTGYILNTAPLREPNRSNDCIVVRENATWEMRLFVLFGKYVVLILAIVHLMFEVYQIIQQGREYLQFVNLLEWTVYVMSITNVIGDLIVQPYTQNGTICGLYQKGFGASALFLAWFNLFLFIRKMPVFGIYIVMFIFVFKTFFKFFIVFVFFIAAFGFSFFVLLRNTELDGFKNPWVAVVKIGVMMTGELNFDDLFFNSGAKSPDPLLWIIFILLVLVLNIILMNLLVGLAVGDIQEVRKRAELTKSIMMINICMDAQNTLANSRFQKLFFVEDQYIHPNRRYKLPKNISEDTFAQIKEILMERKKKPIAQTKDNLDIAERIDSIDEKLAAVEGLAERVDTIDEMQAAMEDMKAMIKDIWEVQPRVAWKRSDKLPTIGSKKEETAKTSDKIF